MDDWCFLTLGDNPELEMLHIIMVANSIQPYAFVTDAADATDATTDAADATDAMTDAADATNATTDAADATDATTDAADATDTTDAADATTDAADATTDATVLCLKEDHKLIQWHCSPPGLTQTTIVDAQVHSIITSALPVAKKYRSFVVLAGILQIL